MQPCTWRLSNLYWDLRRHLSQLKWRLLMHSVESGSIMANPIVQAPLVGSISGYPFRSLCRNGSINSRASEMSIDTLSHQISQHMRPHFLFYFFQFVLGKKKKEKEKVGNEIIKRLPFVSSRFMFPNESLFQPHIGHYPPLMHE